MSLHKGSNLRGIVLMVLAMLAFALADTCIKLAAGMVSPAQVMFLLLAGGLCLFTALAVVQRARLVDRRIVSPVLLIRYVAEIVAIVGMVLALSKVPLSTVGAIIQATPILVAVGAVVWLGETVSWRRWSAICLGFAGVLLIVQPGSAGFDGNALWAVLSMIGLSVRDLTTRMAPSDIPSSSLSAYTAGAALPVSILWIGLDGDGLLPLDANWGVLLSMVVLGSVGYLLLTASIRSTDVSVVSPFRYARLIFMLILGVAVFGEHPSASMLSGAALIVLSGLYVMWRERVVGRRHDLAPQDPDPSLKKSSRRSGHGPSA